MNEFQCSDHGDSCDGAPSGQHVLTPAARPVGRPPKPTVDTRLVGAVINARKVLAAYDASLPPRTAADTQLLLGRTSDALRLLLTALPDDQTQTAPKK